MSDLIKPTKVKWHEISKVGMPPLALRKFGINNMDRSFLCRGDYSLFVSTVYEDGSGFAQQEDDQAIAWALIADF